MNTARRIWFIYGGCALVVLMALVWITSTVLRLEYAQRCSAAEAVRQESLRLALWRMDSWMAPRLAQETIRPPTDYLAFRTQGEAYTKLYSKIEAGEVVMPSPLLSYDSEFLKIHFQVDRDGNFSSPQVPTGNQRDLAEDNYLSSEALGGNLVGLGTVQDLVTVDQLNACNFIPPADDMPVSVVVPPLPETANASAAQLARNAQEWNNRRGTYLQNLQQESQQVEQLVADEDVQERLAVVEGGFVPLWVGDSSVSPELIFVRRVRSGSDWVYQGFLCDWSNLHAALLEQIADLFLVASLQPVIIGPGSSPDSMQLATLPVRLDVPAAVIGSTHLFDAADGTLLLTWGAVLGGLLATAITLQATMTYAAKRARFASAVTHELRTPLTTFRMYTEMLADDMVTDEAQRREYLQTLKTEAGRLSTLVENVMSYARLEDGRRPSHRRETTVAELLERLQPTLEQRVCSAAMELTIDVESVGDLALRTDIDGVGQILFNLIDNACKYAADAEDLTIHLRVHQDGRNLCIDVRDHGPGIKPSAERSIFVPFHRGAEHDAGNTPGIGLGLALSRGLARDLGGDLEIVPSTGGACFRLSLPA